nr:hypothetical protein [Mucilaginibacter sp. X5P1]
MSEESNVLQPFNKMLNCTVNLSPPLDMKINSVFSLFTSTPVPVSYKNLKPDAGSVEIDDLTTGITYPLTSLPPTGNKPVDTDISLAPGDIIEVTVYSGNGNCSITCNGSTETGVSSYYISSSFMPNPSWIVIQ